MMKKWFALYTRPRWEKKVVKALLKADVENYCPMNCVVSQWSDRKKMIFRPLFTSYVFVRVAPEELSKLRSVDGVVNVVYWLGQPAQIRDAEIEAIQNFLDEHGYVELTRIPVKVNDMVKIIKGPLMEMDGYVLEVSTHKVKVSLPSLGYMMIAEVARNNVTLIRKEKTTRFVN